MAGITDEIAALSHAFKVLMIRSDSPAQSVSGAILGQVREHGGSDLQAVGAGAVNQAVKAIAISRSVMAAEGVDLICMPQFMDIRIKGVERTAIRLRVEARGGV